MNTPLQTLIERLNNQISKRPETDAEVNFQKGILSAINEAKSLLEEEQQRITDSWDGGFSEANDYYREGKDPIYMTGAQYYYTNFFNANNSNQDQHEASPLG